MKDLNQLAIYIESAIHQFFYCYHNDSVFPSEWYSYNIIITDSHVDADILNPEGEYITHERFKLNDSNLDIQKKVFDLCMRFYD